MHYKLLFIVDIFRWVPDQLPVSCVEFIPFAGLLNFVIFHVFLALVLFLQFDSKFERSMFNIRRLFL